MASFEEQEAKLAALRAALIDGENSGNAQPFDFENFIANKRKASNLNKQIGATAEMLGSQNHRIGNSG